MLKECKVLLNNEAVTVIQYDNIVVQIPAIGRKADIVKVMDDGSYTVVPDGYCEPAQDAMPAKKTRKKKVPAVAPSDSNE